MRIIPAIDLLDGACVRLAQGDYGRATIYGRDPRAVAACFAQAGASLIHVVDLDGARLGRAAQAQTVLGIAKAVRVPVEVGGGVRNMADLACYLEQGVARVVLGSAALKDPPFLQQAVTRYGGRVILGLDARDGLVSAEGWTEDSRVEVLDLAREMARLGVREAIYTDIARDGMLAGPDLAGLARLVRESGLLIVASGGISSLGDLEAAAAAGAAGAIVGKALYDGRLDLRAAILRFEAGTKPRRRGGRRGVEAEEGGIQ